MGGAGGIGGTQGTGGAGGAGGAGITSAAGIIEVWETLREACKIKIKLPAKAFRRGFDRLPNPGDLSTDTQLKKAEQLKG